MSPSGTSDTPAQLGYRMSAEWEPHERTWMGWPQRPDNWREHAAPAQAAFTAVATAISQFEPVTVCADPEQVEHARSMLPKHIEVVEIPQDDSWFRDTGPTFILRDNTKTSTSSSTTTATNNNTKTSKVAGIGWEFNAWGGTTGGLYPHWEKDNAVASNILQRTNLRNFKCPIVLEGGSIHVDGQGTLLTTEECLLNPNRNPDLSREDIESYFAQYLGIKKVIWLPRGLYGDDDTNGHIDNFAAFAAPGVVLLAWTEDSSDPQYDISQEAYTILSTATDAQGRQLQVVKVPLPPPLYYTEEEVSGVEPLEGTKPRIAGNRLAASYVNFYLCNGGVVMPGFGVKEADEAAKEVLQSVFVDRSVVQVYSREIVLGGGNIHCITQQQVASGIGGGASV